MTLIDLLRKASFQLEVDAEPLIEKIILQGKEATLLTDDKGFELFADLGIVCSKCLDAVEPKNVSDWKNKICRYCEAING